MKKLLVIILLSVSVATAYANEAIERVIAITDAQRLPSNAMYVGYASYYIGNNTVIIKQDGEILGGIILYLSALNARYLFINNYLTRQFTRSADYEVTVDLCLIDNELVVMIRKR